MINMDETVSLRQGVEFFGCMPKKGKTESYGSSIFIFFLESSTFISTMAVIVYTLTGSD